MALEIEGPVGAAHDPADLHRSGSDIFSALQSASLMGHHYLYGRCWAIFGGTNEIQRYIVERTLVVHSTFARSVGTGFAETITVRPLERKSTGLNCNNKCA